MDPYLEGSLWTTLHPQLAAETARQLAPRLRPKHVALTTERFVMELLEDVEITRARVYPDVSVAESKTWPHAPAGNAAIAAAPLRLATIVPTPVPHFSVEIRDTANRELVTAIEILSPTNKRSEGRKEYLARRQRLLLSSVHLMEIDLLRDGQRVPMQQPLPSTPYFVFLSRAENRPITEVWPVNLDSPLPVVLVPLLDGDPDVPLDLQLALTTIYDLLSYGLIVDYAQPLEVPLEGEAKAWASERVRSMRRLI